MIISASASVHDGFVRGSHTLTRPVGLYCAVRTPLHKPLHGTVLYWKMNTNSTITAPSTTKILLYSTVPRCLLYGTSVTRSLLHCCITSLVCFLATLQYSHAHTQVIKRLLWPSHDWVSWIFGKVVVKNVETLCFDLHCLRWRMNGGGGDDDDEAVGCVQAKWQ